MPHSFTGLVEPGGIAVSGSDLFVTNSNYGTIGEYTTSGGTVNASFIPLSGHAYGITASGSDLFFSESGIQEYTTSGAVVNASLIEDASLGPALTASGSDLFFVTSNNTIGEYTTSGAVVNAELASGLNNPNGIVVTPSPTPEPSTLLLLGVGWAAGIRLATAATGSRRQRN
jgi:hypothetical protein